MVNLENSPLGPTCDNCKTVEARCARTGGCCGVCTHKFDGATAEAITTVFCSACGEEFERPSKRGALPKWCPECCKKRYPYASRKRADIPIDGDYKWHVAESGMAHLWGVRSRISYCGMVKGAPIGVPVTGWPAECGRCARAYESRMTA